MEQVTSSRVAVLFGGYWEEREVSMQSGASVVAALREGGLEVLPIRWDRDGWVLPAATDLTEALSPRSPVEVIAQLRKEGLGVVFVALHGGPGEDGTVQGFLELVGVPYTGAGVHASALAMNKESFRDRVRGLGYEVATGGVVQREAWEENSNEILSTISVDVGLPVVVKPLASGSSCGVRLAKSTDQLAAALDELLAKDRSALVERFIKGRELSIACLGTRVGDDPEVLPIIEIESLNDSGFFNYDAKYDPTQVVETVPAAMEDELRRHLEDLAVNIHQEFELGGCSRTDVILGADGPVILETQTIPGLTEVSLLPKCARAAEIEFVTLCRRMIDYSLSAYLAKGVDVLSASGSDE